MRVKWLAKPIGVLAMLSALVAAGPLHAVQPDEMLSNPVLEARARALSKELRCMVCQNQSIDDSDAALARDIRILVRDRLTAGDSDQQVLDYLVARYGEFVLLRPPLSLHTAILWGVPPAALLFGAIAIVMIIRRRKIGSSTGETASLSSGEEARLAELLRRGDG
jgi:cytochrome c-type biogenesis protein CcmH